MKAKARMGLVGAGLAAGGFLAYQVVSRLRKGSHRIPTPLSSPEDPSPSITALRQLLSSELELLQLTDAAAEFSSTSPTATQVHKLLIKACALRRRHVKTLSSLISTPDPLITEEQRSQPFVLPVLSEPQLDFESIEQMLITLLASEEKLIKEYTELIDQGGDSSATTLMMDHLLDEEFQIAWTCESIESIRHPGKRKTYRSASAKQPHLGE